MRSRREQSNDIPPEQNWFGTQQRRTSLLQLFSRVPSADNLVRPLLTHALQQVLDLLVAKKYATAIIRRPQHEALPDTERVGIAWNPYRESSDGSRTDKIIFAQSASDRFDEAFSRAVGEFVERYPFTIYRERKLISGTVHDIRSSGVPHVDPTTIAMRTGVSVSSDTRFLWEKGINMCTGATTLLLAQMVYWNYQLEHRGWTEPLLRERNTCGLASGYSKTVAFRNALYETLQRDAFLITWLSRIPPKRIHLDVPLFNDHLRSRLSECAVRGLECVFYELTTDLPVPTVLCVMQSESADRNSLSLGLGTGFEIEANIHAALSEALALHHWVFDEQCAGNSTPHFHEVRAREGWEYKFGPRERLLLWSRKDMREHMAFISSGLVVPLSQIKHRKFSSIEAEVAYVVAALKAKGAAYEPIAVFSNHPILKMLGSFAVRVVVPALVPMYLEESGAVWGSERLREVPKLLGCEPPATLNPYPQPFP